jgi:hypothetical protein
MVINDLDITTLTIEDLRGMETLLVEQILAHYDTFEMIQKKEQQGLLLNNDVVIFNCIETFLNKDKVKLQAVRVEIDYRFKKELLEDIQQLKLNNQLIENELYKTEIVQPQYYSDNEPCDYCNREIGKQHFQWCRQ